MMMSCAYPSPFFFPLFFLFSCFVSRCSLVLTDGRLPLPLPLNLCMCFCALELGLIHLELFRMAMIEEFDLDQDGEINEQEFFAIMSEET